MSALEKQRRIAPDFNIVYDLSEKPNLTNLKTVENRAVVTKLKADLLLPTNKIMTVEIDFDTDSGYHNNAMMVMDDFGVEMLATAFEVKYGIDAANKVRAAWKEKQDASDPRKPTYLLVQKPENDNDVCKLFANCGKETHPPKESPESIV